MLAALLERERQVVQPPRGAPSSSASRGVQAPRGPVVGRPGVRRRAPSIADRLVGRDAGHVHQVVGRGRLVGQAGLLARRLGERGEDVGRVVELDQLGGALDDLGLLTHSPVISSW